MVIATYYVYILMLALHYFIASFSAELPWKSCDHSWNTVKCFNYGNNSNNFTEQIKHNNTLSYGKVWNFISHVKIKIIKYMTNIYIFIVKGWSQCEHYVTLVPDLLCEGCEDSLTIVFPVISCGV